MKIIISESSLIKTKFYAAPTEVFNVMKNRIYSDEGNRLNMVSFKGKRGREYLMVKYINSDIFKVYDIEDFNGNRENIVEVATALFDVNYQKGYFSGYKFNKSIEVNANYRRRGIATAITDFARNYYELDYKPSNVLSPEMDSFVKNYYE